jgi:DNA-binding transcriptional regulator YiaG
MVAKRGRRRGPVWNAQHVRALRQHLGLTQEEMAAELGSRQQTISEWETGQYQPRGTSARLLTLIAERGGFPYRVEGEGSRVENQEQDTD